MAGQEYRVERDSMGEVRVPKNAYYGAQTQRAVENFPVSGIGFPPRFIRAQNGVRMVSGLTDRKDVLKRRGQIFSGCCPNQDF
jgi:fumarate hydratase class II